MAVLVALKLGRRRGLVLKGLVHHPTRLTSRGRGWPMLTHMTKISAGWRVDHRGTRPEGERLRDCLGKMGMR